MNKLYSLLMGGVMAFSLTACMDSHDEPDTGRLTITATHLAAPNTTILDVKNKFKNAITGNNTFEQVKEDLIFEGVVVANDVSGNLYQTLILRHIGSTAGAADDQCIQVGIKHTILYPYFALGQRVRINLRGLYIGNYSRTPKVGEPYYTSSGNLRLGPMLMERVAHNVQLVGKPDTTLPELTPLDLTTTQGATWLADKNHQNYLNSPILASVIGSFREMQGTARNKAEIGALSGKKEPLPKIFAPEALYDAGYAVNRNLVTPAGTTITLRTSTQNDLSFLPLPADVRHYTGVMSYYSGWQLQLRSPHDIIPNLSK